MKNNFFYRTSAIFLCIFMALCGCVTGSAETNDSKEKHWYCPHVKDHTQPKIPGEFSNLESCGGLCIDRTHCNMCDSDKVVYLTFDAGYENGNVEKILNVLKEESVPGAFFILGNLITRNPELVKRMEAEGHTVCNHTYHHKNMAKTDEATFIRELTDLEDAYRNLTGKELDKFYRPPEGSFTKENLKLAQKQGYQTVFWSFAYKDWDNDNQMSHEKAKSIILENIHNGEVMLLHPTSRVNAEILGDVIRELKNQGFRFGTLSELASTVQ